MRTPSAVAASEPSSTATSRSGRPERSAAIASGTTPASALGKAPSRSVRRAPATSAPIWTSARSSRAATASAWCEQQPAGVRRERAAAAADEQPGAELALERGDLLGDRRLAQRQRLARRGRTIHGGRPP